MWKPIIDLEIGQKYEVMDRNRFIGIGEYLGEKRFKLKSGEIIQGYAVWKK